ncbi:MAG: dockerin type I domain-containing protein [Pirellulales bacterium]
MDAGSSAFWGTQSDSISFDEHAAYISRGKHLLVLPESSGSNGEGSLAPQFDVELPGWVMAQQIVGSDLLLAMNLDDGTSLIRRYQIDDDQAPQMIDEAALPRVIVVAQFTDQAALLQTIEPVVAPIMIAGELEGDADPTIVTDPPNWAPPPVTLQVLRYDAFTSENVLSRPLSSTVDRISMLGSDIIFFQELPAMQPDANGSTDVNPQESEGGMPAYPTLHMERLHIDADTSSLVTMESVNIPGWAMAYDFESGEEPTATILVSQPFLQSPAYAIGGLVTVMQWRIVSSDEVLQRSMSIDLPLQDSWSDTLFADDANVLIGSGSGLTVAQWPEPDDLPVQSSLIDGEHNSRWIPLDATHILQLANPVTEINGSIRADGSMIRLLDVSDPLRPHVVVSLESDTGPSEPFTTAWSVMQSNVIRDSDGSFVLLIPEAVAMALNNADASIAVGEGDVLDSLPPVTGIGFSQSSMRIIRITASEDGSSSLENLGTAAVQGFVTAASISGGQLSLFTYDQAARLNMNANVGSPGDNMLTWDLAQYTYYPPPPSEPGDVGEVVPIDETMMRKFEQFLSLDFVVTALTGTDPSQPVEAPVATLVKTNGRYSFSFSGMNWQFEDDGNGGLQMPADSVSQQCNWTLPSDTNADGQVTPLDVLLIINELNGRGVYALPAHIESSVVSFLPDVNGDQWLTPLDALDVINHINSILEVPGEGEVVSSQPIYPAPTNALSSLRFIDAGDLSAATDKIITDLQKAFDEALSFDLDALSSAALDATYHITDCDVPTERIPDDESATAAKSKFAIDPIDWLDIDWSQVS